MKSATKPDRFRNIPPAELQAITARAIARGTHSTVYKTICSGCGGWAESIRYRAGHTQLCEGCCIGKGILK
jgi:hypothetical protein